MQAMIFMEAPGKVRAWSRGVRAMSLDARIVPTGGHFVRFPRALAPLGIHFVNGTAVDTARVPDPAVSQRIAEELASAPDGIEIFIATDDDAEGDVIALDILGEIVERAPHRLPFVRRARPASVSVAGIERALRAARETPLDPEAVVAAAVPGRARAMIDRWMGATYSGISGCGCGRVRAAVLGMCAFWSHREGNRMMRDLPETGEITLQARAESGGRPFVAHVPFAGEYDPVLRGIAERFAGRLVPGTVRQPSSAGAAIAPRFSDIRPFSTADALAHAERFHGVPPRAAMRGLQDAYMEGRISYPRTAARHLSAASTRSVVSLGRACNLQGLSEQAAQDLLPEPGVTGHEGLHPVCAVTLSETKRLKALVRRPVRDVPIQDREAVRDLMETLVARRAFEACRSSELTHGVWRGDIAEGPFSEDEIARLSDLDWHRPVASSLPWSGARTTGFRVWPLASVLIDGMVIEGVGRPSTLANHAGDIAESLQVELPRPGALPRLTPEGRKVIMPLPRTAWAPATCREIERVISRGSSDGRGLEMPRRLRRRIAHFLKGMPSEIQDPLLARLHADASGDRELDVSLSDLTMADVLDIGIEDEDPGSDPLPCAKQAG